jgi:GT2 family glycosyltransferase
MEKLTISIVTWNSEKTIIHCVESVLNQSFRDFTLYLVDNNSGDNTVALLETLSDSRIKLFRQKENTGFCGGHNFAIRHSSSEFVLLVNPDVIMNKDYVEKALQRMETDKHIGTVCGLLLQQPYDHPECVIDSAGLELKRSGIMRMRYHAMKPGDVRLEPEKVFGADGALPMYRRAMIDDISYQGQFFDEMFFAHKEDWDVSWRGHLYGWTTFFDPSCVAIHPRHFKPESIKVRNNIAPQIKVHSVKNQLILLLKNERLSSFLLNGIFILPRQLMIFFFILFAERSSLKAYTFVLNHYKEIMQKREVIQSKKVAHDNSVA